MDPQGIEIEKKYDVDDAATVPDLAGLPGVDRAGEPHTAILEAVYFDTGQHTLAARRITLRRRTGASDAGWHLKLPAEAALDASDVDRSGAPRGRIELHEPLGQPDVVPDRLLAHLHAYLRGTGVVPVVRLKTRRTTYPLYSGDGLHLADLADDRVEAEVLAAGTAAGGRTRHQWREWELELVHGTVDLFEPAEAVLTAAGAQPGAYGSKLARALAAGKQEEAAPGAAAPPAAPGRKSPAADVVTAYLEAQLREILKHDAGVRLEEPEAVHDLRSATRRVRSVLAAYRRLYSAVAVRRLRDELRWLGRTLGRPRDAEVMLDRLRAHADELPAGEAAAAVKSRLEKELGDTRDSAYRKLQKALLTDRYFRLLDDLESFRDHPPLRREGAAGARQAEGARKGSAKAVDRAAKRLRRADKTARNARRGAAHETALHQVRKEAKKLRDVADAAGPVHGKRAARIAKAARRQQQVLGDFHDSVLARDLLGGLGAAEGLPEPLASAYLTLRTRQVQLAAAAEKQYRKARKKSRKRLRRGVL